LKGIGVNNYKILYHYPGNYPQIEGKVQSLLFKGGEFNPPCPPSPRVIAHIMAKMIIL
jgi:hypothetical protein